MGIFTDELEKRRLESPEKPEEVQAPKFDSSYMERFEETPKERFDDSFMRELPESDTAKSVRVGEIPRKEKAEILDLEVKEKPGFFEDLFGGRIVGEAGAEAMVEKGVKLPIASIQRIFGIEDPIGRDIQIFGGQRQEAQKEYYDLVNKIVESNPQLGENQEFLNLVEKSS